jgi:acetylornithine deacetylase/succinyl-diaminopimelate desuccinylase-like protein
VKVDSEVEVLTTVQMFWEVTEEEAIALLREVIAVKCETELGIMEPGLASFYATKMQEFGLEAEVFEGGTHFYNVPDRCILKTDRRLVPGESLGTVITQIEELADGLRAADPDLKFSMARKLEIPPVATPVDSLIVQEALSAIEEVKGRKPQLTGMFGFTEMAHIHQAGIPAIVCGPGSMNVIHAPNDYVEVTEFMDAIRIYTKLARRITARAA